MIVPRVLAFILACSLLVLPGVSGKEGFAPWDPSWRFMVLNIFNDRGWEYIAPYDGDSTAEEVLAFKRYLERAFNGAAYTINGDQVGLLDELAGMIFTAIARDNPDAVFPNGGDLLRFMIKVDLAERGARGDNRYFACGIDTHFIRNVIPDIFTASLAEKDPDAGDRKLLPGRYAAFIVEQYGNGIEPFFESISASLAGTLGEEASPLAARVRLMREERNKYYTVRPKPR